MNRAMRIPTVLAGVLVGLTFAAGVSDGAARQPRHHIAPQWERALMARSRSLDSRYHLGSYQPIGAGIVPPGRNPDWLRALDRRSIALDQRYHLGTFRSPPNM